MALAMWIIESSVESQDRQALEDCSKGKVVGIFMFKICMVLRSLRVRLYLFLTRHLVMCASSTF